MKVDRGKSSRPSDRLLKKLYADKWGKLRSVDDRPKKRKMPAMGALPRRTSGMSMQTEFGRG